MNEKMIITLSQIEEIIDYTIEQLHFSYYDDSDGEYVDFYFVNDDGTRQERICLKLAKEYTKEDAKQ